MTRMRAPQSNDPQTKTASGQYEVGGFISEIQILKIKIPTAKPTDPAKSKKVTCSKLKKSRYKFIQNSKFFSRITMDHPSPPQVEWPPQTVVCKTSVPPLLAQVSPTHHPSYLLSLIRPNIVVPLPRFAPLPQKPSKPRKTSSATT